MAGSFFLPDHFPFSSHLASEVTMASATRSTIASVDGSFPAPRKGTAMHVRKRNGSLEAVNVNKVATVRNSRGGSVPSVL